MFKRMPLALILLAAISLTGCCCKKCTKTVVAEKEVVTTVQETAVRTSGPLSEPSVEWDSEDLK